MLSALSEQVQFALAFTSPPKVEDVVALCDLSKRARVESEDKAKNTTPTSKGDEPKNGHPDYKKEEAQLKVALDMEEDESSSPHTPSKMIGPGNAEELLLRPTKRRIPLNSINVGSLLGVPSFTLESPNSPYLANDDDIVVPEIQVQVEIKHGFFQLHKRTFKTVEGTIYSSSPEKQVLGSVHALFLNKTSFARGTIESQQEQVNAGPLDQVEEAALPFLGQPALPASAFAKTSYKDLKAAFETSAAFEQADNIEPSPGPKRESTFSSLVSSNLIENTPESLTVLYVTNIFVEEESRGKKIGIKALFKLMHTLKESFDIVSLEAVPNKKSLRQLAVASCKLSNYFQTFGFRAATIPNRGMLVYSNAWMSEDGISLPVLNMPPVVPFAVPIQWIRSAEKSGMKQLKKFVDQTCEASGIFQKPMLLANAYVCCTWGYTGRVESCDADQVSVFWGSNWPIEIFRKEDFLSKTARSLIVCEYFPAKTKMTTKMIEKKLEAENIRRWRSGKGC